MSEFRLLGPHSRLTRRAFVLGTLAWATAFTFAGCKSKRFIRPPGEHDLGEIGSLLFARQHIADRAMLVYRDERGWSCLSTRCTYDGCDLTYQDQNFFCSCCNSHFTHEGRVLTGPAEHPLPYFEMRFKDNHLYALAGNEVAPDYRFTTPEIEAALQRLNVKFREQGISDGSQPIPKILLGSGDRNEPRTGELEELPDESISDMTDTKFDRRK